MNGIRLTELVRSLQVHDSMSRRGIARGTLAGTLGALGLAGADAGKRRKKRRRRKRRKRRQEDAKPHICQGRNVCQDNPPEARCSTDPDCYCFVTAEGEPYCGKGKGFTSCEPCEQQFPGRDCLPGGGFNCFSFICLEPCPV